MKKAILAGVAVAALGGAMGSAQAADLPPRGPIYAPAAPAYVAMYNWTGFYVGAHVGWGTARKEWSQTAPAAFIGNTANFDADGIIGGGQFGYNWQTGNFVLGVEIDLDGSDMSGNVAQSVTTAWTSSTDVNWFGTATARVGYAYDRALLYAKGGFAWADETHRQNFTPAGGASTLVSTVDNTHTGWTVGGGVEVALWDNWTGKIEYDFVELGTENLAFVNGAPAPAVRASDNWDIDQHFHLVKFGLNYRWGGFR